MIQQFIHDTWPILVIAGIMVAICLYVSRGGSTTTPKNDYRRWEL